MSNDLKKHYADKTFDLTNLGAGATLFGQFISEKAFSWIATVVGLLLIVIGYFASYYLYQSAKTKKKGR